MQPHQTAVVTQFPGFQVARLIQWCLFLQSRRRRRSSATTGSVSACAQNMACCELAHFLAAGCTQYQGPLHAGHPSVSTPPAQAFCVQPHKTSTYPAVCDITLATTLLPCVPTGITCVRHVVCCPLPCAPTPSPPLLAPRALPQRLPTTCPAAPTAPSRTSSPAPLSAARSCPCTTSEGPLPPSLPPSLHPSVQPSNHPWTAPTHACTHAHLQPPGLFAGLLQAYIV